tara:strand:+ start:1094 stop:2176 length:1083 start_codon:yes stop_codon:yes gene_type:complete
MSDDDFVQDAEFTDIDEDEAADLILGYPSKNVKVGGSLFFVLFLVISLVSSSIGFYPGIGQINLEIIPLGSSNPDDFGTLDDELILKVYITAPTLGWRSVDQVDYEISYDGNVRTTGSFAYEEARSGEGSKSKIEIDDFFVDNGDYKVKVSAGGNSDSSTVFVARNGKFVEGVMNYHGGSYEDPEYQMTNNDIPQVTLRFTSDASNSLAPRVSPLGFGYMDIFYTDHNSDDNYDEHKWDSCYWNDDDPQCGPTQSRPSNWDNEQYLAQRIYFNISRDSYSWSVDGDSQIYNGVGEDYTIDLVADDIRQNQDSDFSIKIYFTNTYANDFCSSLSNTNCASELDNNEYDGRSYWDWFFLERD